jgi:hypothetical protein
MWRALGELIESGDEASGRLKLEMVKTEDGEQRALRLLRRKPIPENYDLVIIQPLTLQLELKERWPAGPRPPRQGAEHEDRPGHRHASARLPEPKPLLKRKGKRRGARRKRRRPGWRCASGGFANACRQLMMGRRG